MGNLILAAVADKNGHLYISCSPAKLVAINCDLVDFAIDGWLIPSPDGQTYEFFTGGDQSSIGGAVPAFQLKQGTDTFILLGTVANFQIACNECCDASPSGSPVPHDAVPTLKFMSPPHYVVTDGVCTSYFYSLLPKDEDEVTNPLTTTYTVSFYCGGTLIYTTASVTTQAAALADMSAAAAAYGTWTLGTGGLLTLANTGTACDFAAIRVNVISVV